MVKSQYNQHKTDEYVYYFLQSDAVYAKAGVKQRITIKQEKYEDKKKKVMAIFLNEMGRIKRMENEKFIGGQVLNTYYEHDDSGKIVRMQDRLSKSSPNPGYKNLFLDEADYEKTIQSIPDLEVFDYKIEYEGDELKKIVRYNSDGSINREDEFSNSSMTRERKIYKDGVLMLSSTKTFLSNENYLMMPVEYEGIEESDSYYFSDFYYQYEYLVENGIIKGQQEVGDKMIKFYYKKGLLERVERPFDTFIFKYIYYK